MASAFRFLEEEGRLTRIRASFSTSRHAPEAMQVDTTTSDHSAAAEMLLQLAETGTTISQKEAAASRSGTPSSSKRWAIWVALKRNCDG